MSELTLCNRCTLAAMERRAADRGVTVEVRVVIEPGDPMRGWTSARFSDQPEPAAYFQQLTFACAC